MPLIFNNAGRAKALSYITNKATPENLTVKLYQNEYTPTETSTAASFTEADFIGYDDYETTGLDWTISTASPAVATAAEKTFISTADSQSQAIYGYFVVGATSNALYYAERFASGPYTIQDDGHQIKLTPRIQLANS